MTGAPPKPSDCQKPLPGAPVIGFSDLLGSPTRILSLGAGIQSTTMGLMSLYGELPPVKHWLFADTGEEPSEVYGHLCKLKAEAEKFDVTIHTLRSVPLSVATFVRGAISGAGKNSFVSIPAFGKRGTFQQRQCTKYLKIIPIRRAARKLGLGIFACGDEHWVSKRVELWIGISTDEAHRMKPSGLKWLTHTWPLIDLGMSRGNCIEWLKRRGWTAPRSACTFCPYHSDAEWRALKSGPSWPQIVAVDAQLRERGEYLHKALKPIGDVDFSNDEDRGQQVMFGNECEGMCGV